MISAGDFRNGANFEMDGEVYQVVEFQHVKPGKGAAFVRTKYRNVRTGSVIERSFNPNDKFEEVRLERRDMSYLIRTATCTTSWIPKPTTNSRLPLRCWATD